jgi:hypothetical protein
MKTSIICPTFNRASFLEVCIEPVMKIPEAEFVLVDDGSTDGTAQAASTLQKRYGKDRILVVSLGGNQGAQVARNRGMEAATGEMILFCDSDDVLVDSGVKELAEILSQNPDLDYAYGKVVMTDASLKPLEGVESIGSGFVDSPVEIAGYHWHTMGPLYRKSFLNKVGSWNPALTGSQDWEYQARVKLSGGRGRFIDTLVGYWRQHEGGRVGARKFRPDYVRSVVTACDVIMAGARMKGCFDKSLQRRLAKKLLIHSLESGANENKDLRNLCFMHATKSCYEDFILLLVIKGLSGMPFFIDRIIYKELIKK